MSKKKIDNIFISAPENVSWLLNLRGYDNPNSPIPNCRLILSKSRELYLFSSKLNHEVPPTNGERIVMSFNFYRIEKPELSLDDYQNIADIIMSDPHNLST